MGILPLFWLLISLPERHFCAQFCSLKVYGFSNHLVSYHKTSAFQFPWSSGSFIFHPSWCPASALVLSSWVEDSISYPFYILAPSFSLNFRLQWWHLGHFYMRYTRSCATTWSGVNTTSFWPSFPMSTPGIFNQCPSESWQYDLNFYSLLCLVAKYLVHFYFPVHGWKIPLFFS